MSRSSVFCRLTRYAAVVAAAMALTACDKADDAGSTSTTGAQTAAPAMQEIKIEILDHACDPMELTIDAGKVRFIIHNKSNRAVEWEILKGIRIIDERENIPPGFTQKLTTTLDPDTYEMTCGLLSNPRGTLVVRATADNGANRKPTPIELVSAAGEYKVYISTELNALLKQSQALADAIKSGDLATAQALYAPALQRYEHIEPVLKQFSALDTAIAADESVFRERANDPAFSGFHRIERGLFADQSTDNLEPVAAQLLENISALQQEISTVKTSPDQMVGYAAALIREIEQSKLQGHKNLYARTDLWGIQANLDGSHRIFRLVRPMLSKAHPELYQQIEDQYKAANTILETYKTTDGFQPYEQLTEADREALKTTLAQLNDNLSSLPEALGLE
ncbi:iron uptake system protein EfeO [Saezia sanguinis]|uniref:iron uptake system protein EfeO n=1 Tax=Saezia sanguinis TaxID=1965230 RepID=UPI00303A7F3F